MAGGFPLLLCFLGRGVLGHAAALVVHDLAKVAAVEGEIYQAKIDGRFLVERVLLIEVFADGVGGVGSGRADILRVGVPRQLVVFIGAGDDLAHQFQ